MIAAALVAAALATAEPSRDSSAVSAARQAVPSPAQAAPVSYEDAVKLARAGHTVEALASFTASS